MQEKQARGLQYFFYFDGSFVIKHLAVKLELMHFSLSYSCGYAMLAVLAKVNTFIWHTDLRTIGLNLLIFKALGYRAILLYSTSMTDSILYIFAEKDPPGSVIT